MYLKNPGLYSGVWGAHEDTDEVARFRWTSAKIGLFRQGVPIRRSERVAILLSMKVGRIFVIVLIFRQKLGLAYNFSGNKMIYIDNKFWTLTILIHLVHFGIHFSFIEIRK